MFEPRIWSGITDCLPDGHPLQWENLYCQTCQASVHVGNECMTDWVETGKGIYCFPCFVEAVKVVTPARTVDGHVFKETVDYCLEDEWALTFGASQEA
jgi:hypothetical protein